MTLLPAVVLLSGCTPKDAEVTADYAIFLAAASSENLNKLQVTGTDIAENADELGLTPIDCRNLAYLGDDEAIAAARLPGVDYAAECCEAGSGEECDGLKQPRWFGWLDDYAYYLNEGKVEPWRTEAVLTTEGDLQLTVHMDIPPIGDFRFGWVIDPDFQPMACVDGESGAELVEDEGSWLDIWSAREEKGKLWMLNAGAYQINPSNQEVAWYLEQSWQAGYSFARFGLEEFYGQATAYSDGDPTYRPYHIDWYSGSCANASDDDGDGLSDSRDPDCAAGDNEGTSIPVPRGVNPDERYDTWVQNVDDYFASEVTDLATFGKSEFEFLPKLEVNGVAGSDDTATMTAAGRPIDGFNSGFDGWLGVSPSWVRIDNPDDIAIGNSTPITGEFQIYLEGVAAATKVLVRGTFSIDNVREDVWGYEYGTLEEIKREENDTPECGEDRPSGPLTEHD